MKKILTIVIAVLGSGCLAGAQTIIKNEKLTKDTDKVTVSFDIETDVKGLPSRRKEIISPYLYSGKDTVFFDKVEVYGKGRFKRERQVNAIKGDRDWALGENQTLKGGTYIYEAQVPLKRWMTDANLGIRRQLVGCACEKDLRDERLASGLALFEEPEVPARRIPEYALEDVLRQWDFGQDELEIIFKVSRTEIDSTVFDNEVTFGNILTAVDKIFSDPHLKIDKIEIAGYASPEGTRRFNKWLGEGRAKALMNYITSHRPQYGLTEDNFAIRNGEENWQGLRRHLMNSSIKEKESVLAIMDKQISDEQKKTEIKAIENGAVWKKMLKEVYPHLRCARYLAVYYDSTDDVVERINKANAEIRNGDYVGAYQALSSVSEDTRAFNSIGVSLMMQGKFEEAMPWFEKALAAGHLSAQKNRDAINAEYEYEEKQRQIIEEYLKQYN